MPLTFDFILRILEALISVFFFSNDSEFGTQIPCFENTWRLTGKSVGTDLSQFSSALKLRLGDDFTTPL